MVWLVNLICYPIVTFSFHVLSTDSIVSVKLGKSFDRVIYKNISVHLFFIRALFDFRLLGNWDRICCST